MIAKLEDPVKAESTTSVATLSTSSPATLGLLGAILVAGSSLGFWLLTTLNDVENARLRSDAAQTAALSALAFKIESLTVRMDRVAVLEQRLDEMNTHGSALGRAWVDLLAAKNPTMVVPPLGK